MADMQLNSLRIYRNFGKEGYRVDADFEGPRGEVKLFVPGDLGDKIINLCLDEIVSQIQAAAQITTELLVRGPEQAAKELEHSATAPGEGVP